MNVFELFATLGLDTSSYDKGLDASEKKGSSFGQKLGSVIGTGAKIAGAAITATGAATIASATAFVNGAKKVASYGDGIDKLSQKMGFSRQSLQEWDFILQHNGSSIETMKASMKTLANAVANGDDAFKKLGISQKQLKKMSQEQIFAKVISGLQNVKSDSQRTYLAGKLLGRGATELGGLLNMSAKETEAMRKQVHDLGGVLSDDAVKASASFQDSLQNMNTAFSGLKNNMMANFLPSLTTVMDGLAKVFSGKDTEYGMKTIEVGIMSLVDKLKAEMPKFLALGKTIFISVIQGFAPMLPSLVSTIFDIGVQAITTVSSMLPSMMPIIITGIQNSLTALLTALPIIVSGLTQLITGIVNWLADASNVELVVNSIVKVCSEIVGSIGMILPILIPAIATIIEKLATAMISPENIEMLLQAVLTIIGGLAVGIVKALPILVKAITNVVKNLGELLARFFEKAVPLVADGIENIVNKAKKLGSDIKDNVSKFFKDGISNLGKFVSDIIGKIAELPSKFMSIGSDAIRGLWNGISNMSKWIGEKIKGFGKGVLNGLKDFFKIKSPSRLFRDEIGKYLALGVGEGWEMSIPNVIGDMKDSMSGITDDLTVSAASTNARNGMASVAAYAPSGIGNVTINVYAAEGQDIRSLAKQVSEEIQNLIADKEKAYA